MSSRAHLILIGSARPSFLPSESYFSAPQSEIDIFQRSPNEQTSQWLTLGFDKIETWQAPRNTLIERVYIDIEALLNTGTPDTWRLKAWKGALNLLIQKLIHPDGSRVPQLIAFVNNPTWANAQAAVRLGVRDLMTYEELLADYLASQEDCRPTLAAPVSIHRVSKDFTEQLHTNSPMEIPKNAIPFPIEGLEGESAAVDYVRSTIRRSAPTNASVLIVGPTGSGKELVAQTLHRYSERAQNSFVVLDCASINPALFESEIFGHIEGAFTNAHNSRKGVFELAHQGTLFVDQIHLLSLDQQAKLLRVIQDQKVHPVGSSHEIPVDVRLICTSQVSLLDRVHSGHFREDLYYRINVIDLELPALRERRSDISQLMDSFLKKISKAHKKPILDVELAAVEKIFLYDWPGNIRELHNCLERAAILAWSENRESIFLKDLPENIQYAVMQKFKTQTLKEAAKRFEQEYISQTVRRLGGSKEEAAEALGLSLATLYRKIGNDS